MLSRPLLLMPLLGTLLKSMGNESPLGTTRFPPQVSQSAIPNPTSEIGTPDLPTSLQPLEFAIFRQRNFPQVECMLLLIIVCLTILILSFLASSTEASLFSVSQLQIEKMIESQVNGARQLKRNKEKIQDSIIAIVFLNNVSNVAGSILVGSLAGELFHDYWLGVFSGLFTLVIIFFGEIAPKVVGERFAAPYARATSGFVRVLRIGFKPFIAFTRLITRPIASDESTTVVSEDEITLLAHLGHRHGAIQESEQRMINRVFQLNDIPARDIMTPRTVVFALQADRTLQEIAGEIYSTFVSRIPVYEEDLDDITGIVHLRDILSALAKGQGARTLREFLSPVSFIPDTARADVLLRAFQKNREHLAIVVDEYGGVAGVISLEDVLEQLVGEIVDEHDSDVDMRLKARLLRERRK
jgi:CBS domain containing-hemolysin-like protein